MAAILPAEPASAAANGAKSAEAARLADSTAAIARLEAECERYRLILTEVEAARCMTRFHAFDAIKDDCCPCCGSPITVDETSGHKVLKATRL